MRTPALVALLLPAVLAGCTDSETPPVPTGQIDGAVVDHLLNPFAGQAVHLVQLGLTDDTIRLGGFTFREVPVGSYTLVTARDGTQGAAAVVEVREDRITKVILQLLPVPTDDPRMLMWPPHASYQDVVMGDRECLSCARTVPLDEVDRLAEVVLEWRWDTSPLGDNGDDRLRFQVMDDKGDLLYRREAEEGSPFVARIDGADIPDDARELRVQVYFGAGFTPRTHWGMESFVTYYYGATSGEMFG